MRKNKLMKAGLIVSGVLATLVPFTATHAAADATLVNAVGNIATSAQDNVTGVMSSAAFVGFVGLLLSIGIAWALIKKFRKA